VPTATGSSGAALLAAAVVGHELVALRDARGGGGGGFGGLGGCGLCTPAPAPQWYCSSAK